jgi:hypothetical protein
LEKSLGRQEGTPDGVERLLLGVAGGLGNLGGDTLYKGLNDPKPLSGKKALVEIFEESTLLSQKLGNQLAGGLEEGKPRPTSRTLAEIEGFEGGEQESKARVSGLCGECQNRTQSGGPGGFDLGEPYLFGQFLFL